MKIGTFYNILLWALENKEITNIDEGMKILANMGICYYEVFSDTIKNKEDEEILVSALKNNACRVGNLYFKRELISLDSKELVKLMDDTKEIIEQCKRLNCKKMMPVITIGDESYEATRIIHDYYKKVSELSLENDIVTIFENYTKPQSKCYTLNDVKNIMENNEKLMYLLDTGNYYFSKENTTSAINMTKEKIARVHLKDILPCDNSNTKVRYATLGEGISSIKDVIKKLEKNGYDKGFTIEIDYSNPILDRIDKSIALIKEAEKELYFIDVSEKYHNLLFKYAKKFEWIGNEAELKTMHMLTVASLMNKLAFNLHVSNDMHKLAIITGLFHDIGRFEQFKQYHTFRDSISIDHANLSAEIIEKENLLFNLSKKEQDMVLTAIKNHNKYTIEDGLDEKTILLCKMIRDADKIDCFRVVSSEPYESSFAFSKKELEESIISEEVIKNILKHELINNIDRKYPLDYILSVCAFVFDINFDISCQIILENKKYFCGLDTLTYINKETKETIKIIFDEIECFLGKTKSGYVGGEI